jgi:hypothetical protein
MLKEDIQREVIKASDTNGPSADEETNELVNTLRSKYSSLKMNIISEEKKARQLFALLLSKSAKDAQHSRDVDMMKQIEDAAKDVDTVEQSKHISIAVANDSVKLYNEVQLINVDDGNKQGETTIVSDVLKDVVNDVINAMVDTREKTLEANDSTEQHVVDKISRDDKQEVIIVKAENLEVMVSIDEEQQAPILDKNYLLSFLDLAYRAVKEHQYNVKRTDILKQREQRLVNMKREKETARLFNKNQIGGADEEEDDDNISLGSLANIDEHPDIADMTHILTESSSALNQLTSEEFELIDSMAWINCLLDNKRYHSRSLQYIILHNII